MSELTLEEKIAKLTKTVETLVDLELARVQRDSNQTQRVEPVREDKVEVERQLRNRHLGELVTYAINHDLIKRGNT